MHYIPGNDPSELRMQEKWSSKRNSELVEKKEGEEYQDIMRKYGVVKGN
jgi:hypothetical protein